ncbi:nuclear pore complex protein NUP98A-like [Impatiens glandulifera]|uniref:nuclear pore complex protein NUP98A-like n=1 Tax=Impatiens glandulifera TaxID=253017 RepID=UPI001FB08BE3|nr:nuclear pore complex protein NUP98A-like [Impatiens glandulifera]
MFGAGSTPAFGQSSSSPFGSPSIFGQNNNSPSNPFAPKPFGNTTPFGAQTGGSIFGGTSTGVFGLTQAASPLTTTPAFGASPSQAFGASPSQAFGASPSQAFGSMPAFGASSTPAFGASSSASFGSSSVFGQTPAFSGFGSSNNTQANPFGGAFQQSQPAFGSSLFGSTTPFGAPSRPAFGTSSSPAFGATSTPAFGSTSTPAFGSTATGFGASTTPVFGSGGAFGQTNTPAFGASSTPSFAAASTPAFGASSTPAFGVSSAPSFSFGSSPAFSQSTAFGGSSSFGTSTTPFGAQSSPFGAQATTPTFGSTPFGQPGFGGQTQRGGTRVAPYAATTETDSGTTPPGKLESISAMPVYKDKSHDELRWEDYQLGDKGGPSPASQSASSSVPFGGTAQQTNPFASASPFGQASASPFTSTTASNPFAPKTPGFGSAFGSSSTPSFGSSPFASSSNANPFGTTSAPAPTPSIFGGSVSAFGASTSPSLFGSTSSLGFGSSPSASIFGSGPSSSSSAAFGTGFSFANTQSSPLFQSSAPSLGQTSVFGQSGPSFGQSSAPAFGQTSLFSAPSTGFGGNLFSNTPSLSNNLFSQSTPSLSTPVQPAQSSFGFGTFGQSQPATGATLFGGAANTFSQNMFGQPLATQTPAAVQSAPVANPFGTLPAMPQMSIGRNGNAPSVQYGISSLPAVEKQIPARISSLLTSRHLSQRRIRLPARKYHPKNGIPKVPFFSDDEETPSTPKADALFIPRENPRALVIRPVDQWLSRSTMDNSSPMKEASALVQENGRNAERASTLNGSATEYKDKEHSTANGKSSPKPNGTHEDNNPNQKEDSSSYIPLTSHRAGEAAIVYEHGAGIEATMPKLRNPDYYTEPRIQELAAKERAEPGFCRNVKNFVVGRHGYGSIKFVGETDVRRLDLETLIQFNNREVIVYLDESKKPPVGQGLNKAAEVTLLNIKCFDKKTGQQIVDGTRVERYKEMLKKKADDQGAEFVSYDAVKGEWKFRVNHFSRYGL